jgi:excisionase family DNA binding protein
MQTNQTLFPGYLTTAEATRKFGLTSDHIARLYRLQKVPAIRIGRMWLVDEATLRAHLAGQAAGQASAATSTP